MKRIWLIGVVVTLIGCATTPEPVQRGGAMNQALLKVIAIDVDTIITGFIAKLREAYSQGLITWYNSEIAKITVNGQVDAAMQAQIQAAYAQRVAQNDAWLANEEAKIRQQMAYKMGIAQNLQRLQNEYNAAAGIPAEDLQELLGVTAQIVGGMASLREGSDNPVTALNLQGLLSRIGRAEFQAILEAARTGDIEAAVDVVRDLFESEDDPE